MLSGLNVSYCDANFIIEVKVDEEPANLKAHIRRCLLDKRDLALAKTIIPYHILSHSCISIEEIEEIKDTE